jgi:hypothetical protein
VALLHLLTSQQLRLALQPHLLHILLLLARPVLLLAPQMQQLLYWPQLLLQVLPQLHLAQPAVLLPPRLTALLL